MLELFLKGLIAGFLLAAPVGPVGVMCVRRTLVSGPRVGLVSGLGAASADALYGGIVGFGVSWLFAALEGQHILLQFVGGAFLCFLGLHTYLQQPSEPRTDRSTSTMLSAYSTAFFLTMTNPVTMVGFAAIFTSLGLNIDAEQTLQPITVVVAVFLGAFVWWIAIIGISTLMRGKIEKRHMMWMNRLVGLLIAIFGALALIDLMLQDQALQLTP